jgi:hypothetical protein
VKEKKILSSTAESLSRLAETKAEVSDGVDADKVTRHFNGLTKPNSPSKTMRNVGMALLSSPDPVTDVPGAVLIAGSFVLKKRDPTSLNNLAQETRKILRDIRSLSL